MTDPLTQDLLIAMKTNLLSKCSPVFSLVIATMQCLAFHGAPSHGAEPKSFELRLWESGAPDAKGSEPKDIPMAMVRLPESQKPTGAVVVCPGGGYGTLAMGHEGHEIAAWLNKNGIAAIICDYRHRSKGYGHPAPMQDAMRAVRLTRAKASEWNISADRVGIWGFSAGGHLASTVLTQFDSGDPSSSDAIARESSRPDFGILSYPVILFGQPKSHKGSETNLLGKEPDPILLASLQNDTRVTKDTPPTFLFHTSQDTTVPPENAIAFYSAMVKAGVSGELHVYEKGRHGVGLAKTIAVTSDWPNALQRWLTSRGVIDTSDSQ
ncbi:MAG: alpha/beta hydrolase [Planctomycetota bacterium]|jgi:acetyl esterase/lipase|nr:alpha/beta hydrolase [Planctomycetota bacterium]